MVSSSATRLKAIAIRLGVRIGQLLILLLALSTMLFFLLRWSGDPVAVLAPEDADPETLQRIREHHGLDQPLINQYAIFLSQLVRGDFGTSLYSGQPAVGMVLDRIPSTIGLAGLALAVTTLIAIPLGAWLGAASGGAARNAVTVMVSILQGTPGFVTGLILIQVIAVWWGLLPSIAGRRWDSWVLPALTLAAFLVPQLTRVLASSVGEARRSDYVRTALAQGAGGFRILVSHVLPNAMLATAAMIGAQFAALLSGAIITEVVFAWPGLGLLLVDSVAKLDFPVIQAAVFAVAVLVFIVNLTVDLIFQVVDPRLRRKVVAG